MTYRTRGPRPAPRHKDMAAAQLRKTRRLYIVAALLFVISACAILLPIGLQLMVGARQQGTVDRIDSTVSTWPDAKVSGELARAYRYNEELERRGQGVLGEAPDPFSAERGKSQSDADRTYQGLLNTGDGVMGAVAIPKISLNLPIYHGTSDTVLAQGAGHLYGTSLPVGGRSTHAVLTGHRGLPSALLFTRLDELHRGDVFYINVLGETLGYRIDRILVLPPERVVKEFAIDAGQDRVTLMTCTPYGVNTQRLLISGRRARIPEQVPMPEQPPRDAVKMGVMAGFCILVIGMSAVVYSHMRRSHSSARHLAGTAVEHR